SHPVIPDIPGMDLPGVVNCWTLSDAREIAAHCSPDSRLVIYGAGFLGCVILDAVAQTGAHLTIIEPKARLVQSLMDENSSGLIRDWCTSRGIDIVTSSDILEVESSRAAGGNGSSPGRSLYVVLENGGVYAADMVISTIGQESNTGFLAGSGIAVEQGVLVNDLLQTNDPRVFAAGDVCQSPNFSTGERRIQSLQLATEEHGRIAAANMCGKNIKYPDRISMSVLDTLGLVSGSFGLWMGVDGGESAHLVDRDRFRYLNLQFRDDVLVGASTLGFTDYIGLLPGLIQSQVPLNHWKKRLLADPSRVIELVASQPLCESA
ncbi:MAG: FAD-dependent oxidoreductase, partial [Gammaproteobacteria bacterium]|nr:FAD-dependent oxidoreductase [Gammaproteobacteria bacterium]